MRAIYADNFTSAFEMASEHAVNHYDFCSETRIGKAFEILDLVINVEDPSDYVLSNEKINRISYDYAEDFWKFMSSGGTDAEEAFKEYPNVAKFIAKPKSASLPDNFNTFYGPRIVAQLPSVINELDRNPNTRRASILVLDAGDSVLLDKDETLEYPCTISYSFTIREETLYMHSVMRSQNLAVVFQLDIYLQGKLLNLVKSELEARGHRIKATKWSCYMQNAHVFERDVDYVTEFLRG